jgi:transposase
MASVSDTRYKQRAVIEFLVAEEESVGNIHKRLCAVCGSSAVDRSTVVRWVQRVKASGSGETELHDRPRSKRPATATSPDMLQGTNDIIHVDRCITSWQQLVVQVSVSNGSATDSAQQCPPSHKPMNLGGNCQIWLDCTPPSPLYSSSGTIWFSFFGPLKDSLCGTRFEEDESVIRAVRIWLHEQEMSWYREGMHALVSRWNKAVDVDGDYAEK